VIELFRFIDRVMALPPELQQQFKQEVKTYQEERKMPLLSPIEEEAMEGSGYPRADRLLLLIL
jgi:hypothetical protein